VRRKEDPRRKGEGSCESTTHTARVQSAFWFLDRARALYGIVFVTSTPEHFRSLGWCTGVGAGSDCHTTSPVRPFRRLPPHTLLAYCCKLCVNVAPHQPPLTSSSLRLLRQLRQPRTVRHALRLRHALVLLPRSRPQPLPPPPSHLTWWYVMGVRVGGGVVQVCLFVCDGVCDRVGRYVPHCFLVCYESLRARRLFFDTAAVPHPRHQVRIRGRRCGGRRGAVPFLVSRSQREVRIGWRVLLGTRVSSFLMCTSDLRRCARVVCGRGASTQHHRASGNVRTLRRQRQQPIDNPSCTGNDTSPRYHQKVTLYHILHAQSRAR
jgi:hypothetical protein